MHAYYSQVLIKYFHFIVKKVPFFSIFHSAYSIFTGLLKTKTKNKTYNLQYKTREHVIEPSLSSLILICHSSSSLARL